jgi:HD-GYP domain-containing protein (c-di-GMP phosphodiesterase class II)
MLEFGMFVAELDRPWVDTPFLLQGFLIDSQAELDSLRQFCSHVYIDLKFSDETVAANWLTTGSAASDREVTGQAAYEDERVVRAVPGMPEFSGEKPMKSGFAPAADDDGDAARSSLPVGLTETKTRRSTGWRAYQARYDLRVHDATRRRFRDFVRATAVADQAGHHGMPLFGRISGWINTVTSRGEATGHDSNPTAPIVDLDLSDVLPKGVSLNVYQDTSPVESELPRARQTFADSEAVTRDIIRNIKLGAMPDIAAVKACVDKMVVSMIANPNAMMLIAKLRDEDINTYHHGVKVALYLIALGRHLGFPKAQLRDLGLIGMLADIGKIKLPRTLLAKPGMLSPAEFELVKSHVNVGLATLNGAADLPALVLQGILQHHERLDGSGYPSGLTGDQIGVYGQMTAIADSFSAMTTPRPYANSSSPQEALLKLYEWGGSSFSTSLIEQFVQAIGVFPVGSPVELSNGEVAVVVTYNRVRRLEPKVLVLTRPDKSPLDKPIERDLFHLGKSSRNRVQIAKGLKMNAFSLKIRDHYQLDFTAADLITV